MNTAHPIRIATAVQSRRVFLKVRAAAGAGFTLGILSPRQGVAQMAGPGKAAARRALRGAFAAERVPAHRQGQHASP